MVSFCSGLIGFMGIVECMSHSSPMCASGLVRVREWVSGCVAVVCACVFVEVPVCGCARACVVGVTGGGLTAQRGA